ncbi:MAG: dipeptidase [Sediminibacterium sp.]
MRKTAIILSLAFCGQVIAQNTQRMHDRAIVVDTHNDFLSKSVEKGYVMDEDLSGKTQSDLARWKKGGVDVQVFSVWCDGNRKNPFSFANTEMDTLDAVVKRNPRKIVKVGDYKDLIHAVDQHKLAALFGVEGGHMIENDLSKLDSLYKRGARYMTLTWNNSTPWATSAMEETSNRFTNPKKGLNDFGIQVVKRMNELGMIVDLSHTGEQTFWDAIHATSKPVIASHSCVYTLCPVFRNLKDDQIKAIGENGGVIHLNFFSGFIDSSYQRKADAFTARHKVERDTILKIYPDPFFADNYLFEKYADEVNEMRPPLSMLLDHLDYIVGLIGVDHVGLGSDFDGVNSTPLQLDDVTAYPLITKALLERGYSRRGVRKILGENFLRVFKENTKK